MEERLTSREQANYFKLMRLVFQAGKEAIQIKFDVEFDPTRLQNELQRSFTDLQKLKNKRIIKDTEWQLLFPRSGSPMSSTFDIGLMITLLRNLTLEFSGIQDSLPTVFDISESADLSRIKYYRNSLAHRVEIEMSEMQFETMWEDLSQAIIRLGGDKFKHKCINLKEAILDSDVVNDVNEIRKDLKSQAALPEAIELLRNSQLKRWEKMKNSLVVTRACKQGVELMNSKDVVILTGPPGSGKSTILGHICQTLEREDFVSIPCRNPGEIFQYFNSENKQLFVFDDVLGSYTIDDSLLQKWKDRSSDLMDIVETKKCKILVVSRSYIANDRVFSSITIFNSADYSATLNLLSENVCLSNEERVEIAEKYMDGEDVNFLKKQNLLDKYSFFPLLCQLYNERKDHFKTSIDMFFTSPIDMMIKELDGFKNERDQTGLVVLFMFVALNNHVNVDEITGKTFQSRLCGVAESFEIKKVLTTQLLISQLDRLINTYITKSNSVYTIVHEKLFDILVFFYGTYRLDLLIEYGHNNVIRDRFSIEHTGHEVKNVTELDVKISTEMKQKYFDRLEKEILNKSENEVFRNTQWNCSACLSSFIEYMSGRDDIVEYLKKLPDSSSPLFVAIEQSLGPLMQFFIEIGLSVNDVQNSEGATPLYIACLLGNLPCTKLLLENNAEINQGNKKGETPLFAAIEGGNLDIVRMLLSNDRCSFDTKIKHSDEYFGDNYVTNSPLIRAIARGQFDIFCELLNDQRCHLDVSEDYISILNFTIVNDDDKYFLTLLKQFSHRYPIKETKPAFLLTACCLGRLSIVRLLIENGVDPNNFTLDRSSLPLSPEMNIKEFFMTKLISEGALSSPHRALAKAVEFYVNIYSFPLICAIENGSTEIVKLLLEYNANPNDSIWFGDTPLLHALATSACKDTNIIDMLLEKGADPNQTNDKGESSLHLACKDAVATRKLIEAGANVNLHNERLETPLFLAARNGNFDVVQLLLQHNANPNICNTENKTPLDAAKENGFDNIVDELSKH